MKIEIRPVEGLEHLYLYPQQRKELILATGAIGCLSGHLESDCMAFDRYWETYKFYPDIGLFTKDLGEVMEELSGSENCGELLKSRTAMTEYCREHPDSYFKGPHINECGYRLDTDFYTYMIRLLPEKADNPNFWIYAYHKTQLNKHIKDSAEGIPFPSAANKMEAFRIQDGDSICIKYPSGNTHDHILMQCRYCGDSTKIVLVGNEIWNPGQFMRTYRERSCEIIPIRASLPDKSYIVFDNEPMYGAYNGQIGEIRRGEDGIYPTPLGSARDAESNRRMVASLNRLAHVTRAQETAMYYGCQHSWAEPGADPANYDENGDIKF